MKIESRGTIVEAEGLEEQSEASKRERVILPEDRTLQDVIKRLGQATGFTSYKAYLESFGRDPLYVGRSYADIPHYSFLRPGDTDEGEKNTEEPGRGLDVIDVSNNNISLRCANVTAHEISAALCRPPPGTSAQIILWPIDTYVRDIEDLIDVLGLGLQLDPYFFEALRWCKGNDSQHFRSNRCLSINSIGTSVFVARHFALAQPNQVPVVLIAGPLYEPSQTWNEKADERSFMNKAIYDLDEAAPFYDQYFYTNKPCFGNVYCRVLYKLITSSRDYELSPGDILSACIIPLLQIEIAICKGDLEYLRICFYEFKDRYTEVFGFRTAYRGRYKRLRDASLPNGEAPEYLYRFRTKLRSWIMYFERQSQALMSYQSSCSILKITEGPFYSRLKGESILIAGEADRLEAEIRDYLQLQGSKLALLESKKSIEVSNVQIQEGKRVKIFTVLAFIYVPLNLATSVFGMNLQLLNGTGKSFGVFMGTAAIALFVTVVSWWFIDGAQTVRSWLNRRDSAGRVSHDCSIYVRLYMAWWLSNHDLFWWMIRTGAGWCLLIDSSRGFHSSGPLSEFEDSRAITFVNDIIDAGSGFASDLHSDKGGWFQQRNANRGCSNEA